MRTSLGVVMRIVIELSCWPDTKSRVFQQPASDVLACAAWYRSARSAVPREERCDGTDDRWRGAREAALPGRRTGGVRPARCPALRRGGRAPGRARDPLRGHPPRAGDE